MYGVSLLIYQGIWQLKKNCFRFK